MSEPTMIGFTWQPAAPPVQIVAGACVLGLLAVIVYARTIRNRPVLNTGLLLMRLAMVAALAVLLMGPSRIPPETRQRGRAQLSILLDLSASMMTADCQDMTRVEWAIDNWLNADLLRRLRADYDVRVYGFAEELRPLSSAMLEQPAEQLATGKVSRIADSISEALMKLPTAAKNSALLVLSDGHDSDDSPLQSPALLARARNIPVHTVCLGGPTLQRDLALVAMPRQRYLLAGEPGQIVVKVIQVGLEKASTTLHVRCGQEHITRPVEFRGRGAVTLTIPVKQEKAGLYEYKVTVESVAGESEEGNNTQSVFYEVTGQRIKVLILEGEPFWDTKFLGQSLRKDKRIELTQITKINERRQTAVTTRTKQRQAEVPQTAEDLARYDVIILGRGIEQLLSPATVKLLPDFVSSHGGHVIFARGRAYDPATPAGRQTGRELSVLEPVVWGQGLVKNRSLALTAVGRSSPCFAFTGLEGDNGQVVANMPPLTVLPKVDREKAATLVLARAMPSGQARSVADQASPPAVVSMDYGRGKIVAILGEGLWKWSILPPEMKKFDGVYDSFWSNLVRWLAMGGNFMPGQQVSLDLGGASFQLGDPVLADVACKFKPTDAFKAKLSVVGPDGKSEGLVLRSSGGSNSSRLQAVYKPKALGVYRMVLETPGMKPEKQEKKFSVYNIDLERLQTSARPSALQTLAEQSGGRFLPADQADRFPEALARQRQLRIVPRRPKFIWDKGLLLFLLVTWAGAEWLARRQMGLL